MNNLSSLNTEPPDFLWWNITYQGILFKDLDDALNNFVSETKVRAVQPESVHLVIFSCVLLLIDCIGKSFVLGIVLHPFGSPQKQVDKEIKRVVASLETNISG